MPDRPEVYIASSARTAIGSFLGRLASVPAPKLGSTAIKGALDRSGVKADQVELCVMGNVLSAGEGQAPARQAALAAGIPDRVPALTINKVCGSGLEAVILASRAMMTGDCAIAVAGGMENMSLAPYLIKEGRTGYRMGHGQMLDSMISDGLWDPYNNVHMGNCAEECSRKYEVSRAEQDAFAAESYGRAQKAIADGKFKQEIVPVQVKVKKDTVAVDTDEEPGRGDIAKLTSLRPAFQEGGTVTAGNASSINDGGAAVVLATKEKVKELGLKPVARILGWGYAAQEPKWFTTAPIPAVRNALKNSGLSQNDVDLYEINEAFAVVTLVVAKQLSLDLKKVNVNGGAVSLGHPIGASGCRILTTLLHALKERGQKRGLASLCIGGGEGIALTVEMLH
ncbi:MAG: acetyl-CoA C-acetyltransferase [Nitrospirae bacterium]|nr:acetyl-CoA C-acetyltransferase [Nitrospirota bacterium]